MKFDMQQKIKPKDAEKSMEDIKMPLIDLQNKPKEIIQMKLFEEVIKEKCEAGENNDSYYEKPIELYPTGEMQEINLSKGKSWEIIIETKAKSPDDYLYTNSLQLKKLLLANNIPIPTMATREQLIDLLTTYKSI